MRQGDLFGSSTGPSEGEKQAEAKPVRAEVPAPPPEAPAPAVRPPPPAAPVAEARATKPPPLAQPERRSTEPAPRPVLTVSALTAMVKELIEPPFTRVLVRGEVTGFRGPNARGHLYFSIKDDRASLDVRIWASNAQRLKFQLKDGLAVVVEGALNVYEPQGRYSLIAHRIEPEGVGALALAFEQLKKKLSAEGLIGEGRTQPRRPLPTIPRRIGVVTSTSGAALKDFLKVLYRRHPRLSVLVADARVQGEGSAADVCRAIRWLAKTDVDVLVVTRGGGSVDDLWTFNEEAVVRAIFACPVPVVSAVGHEVDVTLSDLVADVRAPTPSAAAELLAPVLSELELSLATSRRRLEKAVERHVLHLKHELKALEGELGDPRHELARRQLQLSELGEALAGHLRRRLKHEHHALRHAAERLERNRPQAQLRERREALHALKHRLLVAGQRRARASREELSQVKTALARVAPRPLLERERLKALAWRLEALSPLKVLGRGYALVHRQPDGALVRGAADVAEGDDVRVTLSGEQGFDARVTKVRR